MMLRMKLETGASLRSASLRSLFMREGESRSWTLYASVSLSILPDDTFGDSLYAWRVRRAAGNGAD